MYNGMNSETYTERNKSAMECGMSGTAKIIHFIANTDDRLNEMLFVVEVSAHAKLVCRMLVGITADSCCGKST